MSMDIYCDECGHLLQEPGALVFSPPVKVTRDGHTVVMTQKFHICKICWDLDLQDVVTPAIKDR